LIQNVWIAIKSIADKRIHKEEFENLKELRKCLSKHGSIMVNIATIIQDGGMSGPVHHLIYELAAYDLDVFLTTARGHTRSIRHDSAGPKRTNSALMRPRDLMHESVNLADALEYLHHRLIYTGASISLAHNDIKPGNVLVFYPDGADTEPHCPVGHWKIADFGLSKIKHRKPKDLITPLAEPASLGPSHRRDNSVSKTAPKRAPGRYTAPELDQDTDMKTYGTEADVWSFGCVFAEILAYCIDLNHEHVEELRQGLEEDSKDDRFYDVNNKQVKTSFLNHLESLKTKEGKMLENDAETIKDCVDLINKIVRTDPHARLGAREINNELRSIYNSMSSGLHIDTSQNASESNSIRPSAVQSPKDLNGHLNGDYRFPEFERMTTPTFLFSGLGDDEDSL
jgi:serine/threonine protein kinase